MAEADTKQIYNNALPLIAVVMMASGIIVKSVPLESRRPVDPQRVAFVHAGRQDIEARLWEDPFTAIRGVKGDTPGKRCKEAMEDGEHQRLGLHKVIANRTARGDAISVLAVTVLGGPYFEEGEARRRSRYAVVSALLQAGWEPVSEDKLGYVWTLESCVEPASARWAPELLPYEWFRIDASGEAASGTPRRDLLVLWVDESSISRRPLKGIERIVELLAVPCPSVPETPASETAAQTFRDCPKKSGPDVGIAKPLEAKSCNWRGDARGAWQGSLPWCETRVIGPATSVPLEALVRELARAPRSATSKDWLRFYSSGATAYLEDSTFKSAIEEAKRAEDRRRKRVPTSKIRSEAGGAGGSNPGDSGPLTSLPALKRAFEERVVRLTTTDEKLTLAFAEELGRRLVDPTPFSRIRDYFANRNSFCESTFVLVSEGDTSYARAFRDQITKGSFKCPKDSPRVVGVSYLRGLDGVLPVGAGAPVPAVAAPQARAPDARDALLDPVTLERADGRSQFDYLRRLAQLLGDIDREEKRGGRGGIRGVGIVGNDAYDKLLVLDALRDRFPDAVFFTADLDARLIGAGARSTRNLVVASAYGLVLTPDVQGAAPPFRDTYQTGTYLATRVALDPGSAGLPQAEFDHWFSKPLLFEVGRTRAVPLSLGSTEECDLRKFDLVKCPNIHARDEWINATPFPSRAVSLALALMAATAAALALLLSGGTRESAARVLEYCSPRRIVVAGFVVLGLVLFVGLGGKAIWDDAISGFGEPFAWFEGVSIWPTQIFRSGILVLTLGLFAFGRWQLHRRVDRVAEEFSLATLSERAASPPPRGWKDKFRWIWGLGIGSSDEGDPWTEYLERMRFGPSFVRIAVTAALFFAFSVALTSLDWPRSPHRGELAAWFNHGLLLLLLLTMTALLFAALDASSSATRLLARLRPGVAAPTQFKADEKLLQQYPVGERAIEPWVRFRLAVRVASEVNWFIYLPFLTLLLIIPTQSSVFDAWNLPLPFAALMAISIGLAALCARGLRRSAARVRDEVLEVIETEVQNCRLPAGQAASGGPGSEAPPEVKAVLLKRIAEQIRAVRDGPFLPLSQEPAVRAILLVLGGAGGISTLDFLLLSRG